MRNNYVKVFFVLMLLLVICLSACQKHEHVYGEWSTTVEATCEKYGVQARTCSCGAEETKPINAIGHSYGEWITTLEATCENDGVQIRTCSCGEEETKPIKATGHSYGEWETALEATCVNDGIQTRACSCGAEETMPISATGNHLYGEWVITTAATCVNEGIETRTCDCGAEETKSINATGIHSYGKWVTTTVATCANNGVQTRTCSCGAKETKTISATEHSYGNWSVAVAASCTKEGVKARTCDCGHQETKPLKKLAHKWKNATCTSPKTCTKCFATVGDPLEHSMGCNGYCTMCGRNLMVDMRTLVGKPGECSSIKKYGFCFYSDSNDNIKVCWGGQNLSGKTINSYTVTIYFYDADGDPAYSKLTGNFYKTVTHKENVLPGDDLVIFEVIDCVPKCSAIIVGDVSLEYTDGTSDIGWYGWGTMYKKDLR